MNDPRPAPPSLRELINSASAVQMRCAVSEKKTKQACHHSWGWVWVELSHIFYSLILYKGLSVTKYGFSLLWLFSLRSATAAQLFSRDPARGSGSPWHKMDPNLRHKEWVKPTWGIAFLSLRVICSLSIIVPVSLPCLPIFSSSCLHLFFFTNFFSLPVFSLCFRSSSLINIMATGVMGAFTPKS